MSQVKLDDLKEWKMVKHILKVAGYRSGRSGQCKLCLEIGFGVL